ncbi:MAG: N,N-dimethylformamidase beta subunit family domain-containing protein [Bacteroidota bacterium]
MLKALKNRYFIAFLLISLISASIIGFSIAYHFYYLFPNSHSLFQIRHNHFQHLEFYTDKWNYEAGEKISIFASAAGEKKAQLFCFNPTGNDTLLSKEVILPFQELAGRVSIAGTGWEKNLEVPIPSEVSTGWYLIQLRNSRFRRTTSVFISPKPEQVKKSVALLLSTNTWNAYNHWGGQSLYSANYTPEVSFLRPQLLADPFIENTYPNQQLYYQAANIDLPLAMLLDSVGIEFDVYAIEELHRSAEKLIQYESIVLSTHPEYWSEEMLVNLNICLDSGSNLINLGGNTAAWYSELDIGERKLKVHKGADAYWRENDSKGLRPFGLQETAWGFHSFGPYEVLEDTSFVWENTGLKKGDLFGEISETYDYAYAYEGKWELLLSLFRKGRKGAAAGMEIDKLYPGTPTNWITLARGWNQQKDGAGIVLSKEDIQKLGKEPLGADLGYYIHPGGGMIFQTGSLAFCGAIPYDRRIRQIIVNVVSVSMLES